MVLNIEEAPQIHKNGMNNKNHFLFDLSLIQDLLITFDGMKTTCSTKEIHHIDIDQTTGGNQEAMPPAANSNTHVTHMYV